MSECPIGQLKSSGTAAAASGGGDSGDDDDEASIEPGGDGGGVGGASDAPLDGVPKALRAGPKADGRYGSVSPVGCDMTIHWPDMMLGPRRRPVRTAVTELPWPSSGGARASTSRRGGIVCASPLSALVGPPIWDRCAPNGVVHVPSRGNAFIEGMRSLGMSDASLGAVSPVANGVVHVPSRANAFIEGMRSLGMSDASLGAVSPVAIRAGSGGDGERGDGGDKWSTLGGLTC